MRILLFFIMPLVFFGAGLLFANLIWGKYKQLCAALRDRLDTHIESEEALQKETEKLRKEFADQETTCRTLEEELIHLGKAREDLQQQLKNAHAKQEADAGLQESMTGLKSQLQERQTQQATLQQAHDRWQREASTQQEQRTAAENRAQQLEREKDEVLALVSKLQSRLEKLDQQRSEQAKTLEEQRQLGRAVRRERIRRRRAQREAQTADAPSRRRQPRGPIRTSKTAAAESGAPLAPRPEATAPTPASASPTQEKSASVTQRVLQRLFPETSPPPAAAPKKRRKRW